MGSLIHLPVRRERLDVEVDGAELDSTVFWGPLLVVWLASIARVALAFIHRNVFDTEATLAFAYLLALPIAAARHWRSK